MRYPAVGPAGTPERLGAAANRADGPYPLIIFSGGYGYSPQAYRPLLNAWAAAGYVVAAPDYPYTDPSSREGLNESDIVNHPADLRFVITSLLRYGATRGGSMAGLIEDNQVAVIGHSDGGDVSLATARNSCCEDNRIKALVVLSGAELLSFKGRYFSGPSEPLLVVQGTADRINPPSCSAQLYDQAPKPKYFLALFGQGHIAPYTHEGQPLDVVAMVTIDFLNGYLKGSISSLRGMAVDGTVPSLAGFTNTPTIAALFAPVRGPCAGAPPG